MAGLEFAGTTFDRERIRSVAQEVSRRSKAARDFAADRRSLKVVDVEGGFNLSIDGQDTLFPIQRQAYMQVAEKLNIPTRYLDRLVEAGHRDMVVSNLQGIIDREQGRHLVRTLDGQVRAFLSDRYRSLDNQDLLAICLREVKAAGAEVWDLRLTDNEFRFLAVAPQISGQVSIDRTFDPGDGWMSRWAGKEGDTLNAALTVSNSETGHGGLNVRPAILRKVCANFCVWQDGVARVHIGGKIKDEGEIFFSDDTKRQEDKVIWMKVTDVVRSTFTPAVFQKKIEAINATTKVAVEKPVEAVEAAVKNLGLPSEYRDAILEEFLGSGDKSQWGLVNALTEMANPERPDLDDSTRNLFEDVGGQVLAMSERQFEALIEA